MLIILDSKLGNVGSVGNMLKKIGAEATISSEPTEIEEADRLILPGVGHFDTGMRRLHQLGFVDVIRQKALVHKTPILGICLGMQLMTRNSEEGTEAGLDLITADTIQFRKDRIDTPLRFPHMGWNTIVSHKHHDMFLQIEDESRFYFVHNFHVVCDHQKDVLTTTDYGYQFVSAFQHDNIWGVQFHPEKSHRFGMHFLKKWLELC